MHLGWRMCKFYSVNKEIRHLVRLMLVCVCRLLWVGCDACTHTFVPCRAEMQNMTMLLILLSKSNCGAAACLLYFKRTRNPFYPSDPFLRIQVTWWLLWNLLICALWTEIQLKVDGGKVGRFIDNVMWLLYDVQQCLLACTLLLVVLLLQLCCGRN